MEYMLTIIQTLNKRRATVKRWIDQKNNYVTNLQNARITYMNTEWIMRGFQEKLKSLMKGGSTWEEAMAKIQEEQDEQDRILLKIAILREKRAYAKRQQIIKDWEQTKQTIDREKTLLDQDILSDIEKMFKILIFPMDLPSTCYDISTFDDINSYLWSKQYGNILFLNEGKLYCTSVFRLKNSLGDDQRINYKCISNKKFHPGTTIEINEEDSETKEYDLGYRPFLKSEDDIDYSIEYIPFYLNAAVCYLSNLQVKQIILECNTPVEYNQNIYNNF
jgi:hypothetical protein